MRSDEAVELEVVVLMPPDLTGISPSRPSRMAAISGSESMSCEREGVR